VPTVRRYLGGLVHWLSDELHLLAHRLIGDPEWRARNGPVDPVGPPPFQPDMDLITYMEKGQSRNG
jgi:hypothetical protein